MNTQSNLEQYRKRLKLENLVSAAAIAALLTIQILAFCRVVQPPQDSRFAEYWTGFIAGAAMGVMLLMLIGLIQNLRAMKNEQALQKLYNKNHDERSLQIATRGQAMGARLFVIVMLPASIISGYFNVTVFVTCVAAVFGLSVFMGLGKLYFKVKLG